MVMSIPTSSFWSDASVASREAWLLVGFAREMPTYDPPRKWMRLVSAIVRGITCVVSPAMSQRNPSLMPRTSTLDRHARIVAAPMTLLIPGAGPPATTMASFFGADEICVGVTAGHLATPQKGKGLT